MVMLQQVNDGFAPDRERVADANASVPTIDMRRSHPAMPARAGVWSTR